MKRTSWILVSLILICSTFMASCGPVGGGGSDGNQGDGNNANADNGDDNGDSDNSGEPDRNSGNDSGGEASIELVLPIDVGYLTVVEDFDTYADAYIGWITVHKQYQISTTTYVIQDGEIPFLLVATDPGGADFSKPVPIIGYGDGSIETSLYGEGPGGSCVMSGVAAVKYKLKGAFYADQCTIWFKIVEEVGAMDAIDECNGGIVLSGVGEPYSVDLIRDFFIEIPNPLLVETYGPGENLWYLKRWNPGNSNNIPCGNIDMEIDVDTESGDWEIPDSMKPFIEEVEIETDP